MLLQRKSLNFVASSGKKYFMLLKARKWTVISLVKNYQNSLKRALLRRKKLHWPRLIWPTRYSERFTYISAYQLTAGWVQDRESSTTVPRNYLTQEALLSQRGRAMLSVCIASIQNVERSLLLLVVSASDIPLRTIKFCSVLFSSAYSSMLQAVTNKHSLVRRGLCDLHCIVVGNCFCHFVVRTSSNRSIASGVWPTVIYTASLSVKVFGTSHVQQSSIASY